MQSVCFLNCHEHGPSSGFFRSPKGETTCRPPLATTSFRERSTCSCSRSLHLGAMHGWGITERLEPGVARRVSAQSGLALPRALSPRATGPRELDLENDRTQSARPILLAHRRGPSRARRGTGRWERQSEAVNLVLRMSRRVNQRSVTVLGRRTRDDGRARCRRPTAL